VILSACHQGAFKLTDELSRPIRMGMLWISDFASRFKQRPGECGYAVLVKKAAMENSREYDQRQ
jgi:hypothetical protein